MLERYTHHSLTAIVADLEAALAGAPPGTCCWREVLDPDVATDRYSGEPVQHDGTTWIYRDLRTWADLAEGLGLALCTPRPSGPGRIRLGFRALDPSRGWHRTGTTGDPEKYGADTAYARLRRAEEPTFLLSLRQALRFLAPPAGATVLAVGANQGDELALIAALLDAQERPPASLIGLDHSASAVEAGQARLGSPRLRLQVADLRAPLPVGRADLIVAINVLHSPGLDGQELFRRLRAKHLADGGGMLIGLPCSRHIDHRLRFGPQVRNYSHPELSVLHRMAAHFRRTLQRRGFHVTLTGKHTLLITARTPPAHRPDGAS